MPVHPRACGEHRCPAEYLIPDAGSSPRLRGTPSVALADVLRPRFIPAACGEHSPTGPYCTALYGSSPRLRGTRAACVFLPVPLRFIPAPAGNTSAESTTVMVSPVHPRACGEHAFVNSTRDSSSGSSPRLRGTLLLLTGASGVSRFIPAPAGNTDGIDPGRPVVAVHPRACGEHQVVQVARGRRGGSSPRLRGTHSRRR